MAVIEVNDLTYTYPGNVVPVVKNVSFCIEAGQRVAVVGANGAGKSTLCLALAGLIPALFHGQMQGTVTVCDLDTRQHTPSHFAGRVGLVLQNPASQLSGMRDTVYEEVAFGLENLGTPRSAMPDRIERALQQVGLADVYARSPLTLSGGQQQRLALASVLVLDPAVLVLDEPTAMLDPAGSQAVLDVIRTLAQAGTTIIVVEHRLEWISSFADRVLALVQGALLLDGTPRAVLTSSLAKEAGIGWLRFTKAAYLGKERGLWPDEWALPVTLEQTAVGFQRHNTLALGLEQHDAYPG